RSGSAIRLTHGPQSRSPDLRSRAAGRCRPRQGACRWRSRSPAARRRGGLAQSVNGAAARRSLAPRSGPGRRAAGSCDQRSPGKVEEGQEEGARREGDRQPENDLDQSAHPARGLAEGESQARADDDDDCDDLGNRTLDAVEDLSQRLFPGHVRAGRQGELRPKQERDGECRKLGEGGVRPRWNSIDQLLSPWITVRMPWELSPTGWTT